MLPPLFCCALHHALGANIMSTRLRCLMGVIEVPTTKTHGLYHGFCLDEEALRRIFDLMCEQLRVATPDAELRTKFSLEFSGGVESDLGSIDEVLAQDNSGELEIKALKLIARDENLLNHISVHFSDPSRPLGGPPIFYCVQGESRDWVFVTSSKLEDRFAHVKRFAFTPRLYHRSLLTYFLFTFVLPALITLAIATGLFNLVLVWGSESGANALFGPLLVFSALLLLGLWSSGLNLFRYLFPPYNFYWGDYVAEYDKRRRRAAFLFNVVVVGGILALLMGLLGSYIYDKFISE